MKVALVHDYIKEYGGAERVLESLHAIYPDAPVYTSVYLPDFLGPHKERFATWDIRTSPAQYLPFKAKLISPLRILSPWLFKQFDLSSYDVIIVSATGAYFPNSVQAKGKGQRAKSGNPTPSALRSKPYHICYCHTPPRYLYGYATAREWKKNALLNIIGETMNHFLRIVDFHASQNVDQYIANSEEIKKRIEKFYRREALVIYPPIKISSKYQVVSRKQKKDDSNGTERMLPSTDYYIAGGRLARPKHIDLIIRACRELDIPLKIFGKAFAGYGEELKEIAQKEYSSSGVKRNREVNTEGHSPRASLGRIINNIQFLGEVSDEEKGELLRGAKAYLFASEDEDFGILPVEAMAAGTPVIAYRSGGVQETVVDGKTGLFFDELTVTSLTKAIQKFDKEKFDKGIITKRAENFSEEVFRKNIQKLVTSSTPKV